MPEFQINIVNSEIDSWLQSIAHSVGWTLLREAATRISSDATNVVARAYAKSPDNDNVDAPFRPSHVLVRPYMNITPVMLLDGCLYTATEWYTDSAADWTFDSQDGLLCLGRVEHGTSIQPL